MEELIAASVHVIAAVTAGNPVLQAPVIALIPAVVVAVLASMVLVVAHAVEANMAHLSAQLGLAIMVETATVVLEASLSMVEGVEEGPMVAGEGRMVREVVEVVLHTTAVQALLSHTALPHIVALESSSSPFLLLLHQYPRSRRSRSAVVEARG